MSLREWPGFRALGVVFLWVALVFVVFAWRSYWRLSQTVADQGVAAASFDLKLPLILAFGPPMLGGLRMVPPSVGEATRRPLGGTGSRGKDARVAGDPEREVVAGDPRP